MYIHVEYVYWLVKSYTYVLELQILCSKQSQFLFVLMCFSVLKPKIVLSVGFCIGNTLAEDVLWI